MKWLQGDPRIATCIESRALVAGHRFMEEVHRFKALTKYEQELTRSGRRMVRDHYRSKRLLLGRRLLVDKEPLETIAFPDRRFEAFLANVRLLLPEARFLFIVRNPVASVFSMSQREWGLSLADEPSRRFPIEEHVESWRTAVDAMLAYADDPGACICSLERLCSNATEESNRICDFLQVRRRRAFSPRPPRPIRFGQRDRAFILESCRPQIAALSAYGLSDPF